MGCPRLPVDPMKYREYDHFSSSSSNSGSQSIQTTVSPDGSSSSTSSETSSTVTAPPFSPPLLTGAVRHQISTNQNSNAPSLPTMNKRTAAILFHTTIDLPPQWPVCEKGYATSRDNKLLIAMHHALRKKSLFKLSHVGMEAAVANNIESQSNHSSEEVASAYSSSKYTIPQKLWYRERVGPV